MGQSGKGHSMIVSEAKFAVERIDSSSAANYTIVFLYWVTA